jgi:hypothetical protein
MVQSADAQVDLIDVERFGGTLIGWHRVATIGNSATPVYHDDVTEAAASAGPPLELRQYQPFPVTDQPHQGTCNIAGTRMLWVSGDQFNLNWVRGVEVIIDNKTYTLHAPPVSATIIELEENVGFLNGVDFYIPEATIAATPLPVAWLNKSAARVMALGDKYNPGWLYFSNADTADTASDEGWIEVSSPSEPLLNGLHYEGADYVWSADGMFRVESTPGGLNPFASYRLGLAFGLAAPWAVCSGPEIYFRAQDGIYSYSPGGGARKLTEDIYQLFPHEGVPGLPVCTAGNPLYPPDDSQASKQRLHWFDNYLYFDYIDTNGQWRTLAYNTIMGVGGWLPYVYTPGISLHYQEEGIENPATLAGGSNGKLYQLQHRCNDAGTTFDCVVVTPADDQEDTRAQKQYGDVMVDFDGSGLNIQVYYDNFLTLGPAPSTWQLPRRDQVDVPLTAYSDSLHRNVGLMLWWQPVSRMGSCG